MESHQEIVSSKESEINELKSELQKNQDRIKLLVSQLTTEKKMSKDVDIQFDFTVPATGEYDNQFTENVRKDNYYMELESKSYDDNYVVH